MRGGGGGGGGGGGPEGWLNRGRGRGRVRYFILVPLIVSIPLLLSVSELHRGIFREEPGRKISKKSDHLVLGPAAGQGLPNRLQCRGLKAMNKIKSSSAQQNLSFSFRVSFVTVFTIYNSTLRSDSASMDAKVTVGSKSFSKSERSMAILNTFIGFIQVSMPKSDIIILTDPASEFSVNRPNSKVVPIQGDYSRGNLMLQRIESYIIFLSRKIDEHPERLVHPNHYVFTDSDVAVVDDIGHTFKKYPHFHLALTFRNNKDQPLNSGFIAVRGSLESIVKAKAFLQEVLDTYRSQYMKASRMLGDQLALAYVVKFHIPFAARSFSRPEVFSGDISGTSILFLPCAIYNWTPPEGAGQFHGMPLDVQVVHFKGSRKRLMLECWNFFSSTSNMSDMLCLVLKSGRAKYDF